MRDVCIDDVGIVLTLVGEGSLADGAGTGVGAAVNGGAFEIFIPGEYPVRIVKYGTGG